jgi:hypothetical protein
MDMTASVTTGFSRTASASSKTVARVPVSDFGQLSPHFRVPAVVVVLG